MSFDAAPPRLRNAKCERLVPAKKLGLLGGSSPWKNATGSRGRGTAGSTQLTRAARVRSGFQYKIGTARRTSGLRRPFPLHARDDTRAGSGVPQKKWPNVN